MRLLNVDDWSLREFRPASLPRYVITSHRWNEGEEALMADLREGREGLDYSKSGHRKIGDFVEYVKKNFRGIEWIWHDTCCIDKTSSQEVTTAINSMFQWYLNAEVCLAYLHDVPTPEDMVKFSMSSWFKRGWTLQELVAPHLVVFLSEDWRVIGHKGGYSCDNSGSSLNVGPLLTSRISALCQIPESVLKSYAEAQHLEPELIMKWTKGRETTVEEDLTYCLLGLLGVSMPVVYGEGDAKARKRLLRELRDVAEGGVGGGTAEIHTDRPSSTANAESGRLIYLPFQKNRQFVGRTGELKAIEQKLFIDADCQKTAIFGLGGIGKTQIALTFAFSVLDRYPSYSVFWVSALSAETFEQAFNEIARLCDIYPNSDDGEDIKPLVKRHLSARTAGYWLIIVDNIDSANVLQASGQNKNLLEFLPESTLGSIVFTTRSLEIAQSLVGSDVVQVERMGEKEAFELFAKSLVDKDAIRDGAAIVELLLQLDCLPLAITQAAAYMNVNSVSVSDYVSLLNSTEQDLVHIMSTEIRDRTRHEQAANAVATTWIVSFTQIVEQDPVAADLLRYISCIEWKGIPYSILPTVQPEARMVSAIGRLCSYSFLTRRSKERIYDMHRLVHLAIRIWTSHNDTVVETRELALETLLEKFPGGDYAKRETWREYVPHVAHICKDGQGEDTAKLCWRLGTCLRTDGRYGEAVLWFEKSLDLRMELPEDHPLRLLSQTWLAEAYRANWQVKDALKLFEHVVQIQSALAEDDPSRLMSQRALAGAYKADGQVKAAIKLLEHVVEIKRKLAEDDGTRLASEHELARAYMANGQLRDAIKLLEHVVEKERTLTEDNPSRLAAEHALAQAYTMNGQTKAAIHLLEHVVKMEEALAEDHPDRLSSQHALAQVYRDDGQIEAAVRLLEHVIKVEEGIQDGHQNSLPSQSELARIYHENGQVKDAIRLLERVVRVGKDTFAEDHPHRLPPQHELARAYYANGQVDEAIKLLEHVVRIGEKIFPEDHPDRLASQHELARAYNTNGQAEKAIELLEYVVRMDQQIFPDGHPDRLLTQHELARMYHKNGQVKDAVRLLEPVVRVEKDTFAEDHPHRLALQHELARAYLADGQVDEAIKLLEHVVRVGEKTFPEDHPARLASQHELAQTYNTNGQAEKAIELLEHVVRTNKKVLPDDHPDRLRTQHELARTSEAHARSRQKARWKALTCWLSCGSIPLWFCLIVYVFLPASYIAMGQKV